MNLANGIRTAVAQPTRLAAMRDAALTFAARRGWDLTFENVIADYRMATAEAQLITRSAGLARAIARA